MAMTNISHLGKRKIIFKCSFWRGYVSFLEGSPTITSWWSTSCTNLIQLDRNVHSLRVDLLGFPGFPMASQSNFVKGWMESWWFPSHFLRKKWVKIIQLIANHWWIWIRLARSQVQKMPFFGCFSKKQVEEGLFTIQPKPPNPLKMDDWKMKFPVEIAYFQGRAVGFREGNPQRPTKTTTRKFPCSKNFAERHGVSPVNDGPPEALPMFFVVQLLFFCSICVFSIPRTKPYHPCMVYFVGIPLPLTVN